MTKKLKRGPAPLTVGDLHYIAKLKEQGRVWRSELPDKPGWWWLEYKTEEHVRGGERDVVEVANFDGRLFALALDLCNEFNWLKIGDDLFEGCRWAGPIPEPIELEEGL